MSFIGLIFTKVWLSFQWQPAWEGSGGGWGEYGRGSVETSACQIQSSWLLD